MTVHLGSNALVAAGAVVLLAIAAAAAGWIPLGQLLWLGLVLICPLMMFFMMRGTHQANPTTGAVEQHHREVEPKEESRR